MYLNSNPTYRFIYYSHFKGVESKFGHAVYFYFLSEGRQLNKHYMTVQRFLGLRQEIFLRVSCNLCAHTQFLTVPLLAIVKNTGRDHARVQSLLLGSSAIDVGYLKQLVSVSIPTLAHTNWDAVNLSQRITLQLNIKKE